LSSNAFIFRGLSCCIVLLFAAGVLLHHKNKQLTEVNNKLLLLNDSVLSVNLQLQKDVISLKHGLDSMGHNTPEKQQLTRR